MTFFRIFSFFLIGCAGLISQPEIIVSKQISLIDERVDIQIRELVPCHCIELVASFTDSRGKNWISKNLFRADGDGKVDLCKQAPISGTYEGIDPMGIFWSMQREDGNLGFASLKNSIDVELKVAGKSISLKRLVCTKDVQRIEVREDGLVGTLFLPSNAKEQMPVVVTLSGSNGGISESRSGLLASHGIASFALGYFRAEGLPENLQRIELEYFEKAFDWIENHPLLDGQRISLYGVSRGAELSLLLGSIFPDRIERIVAVHSSSLVYAALGNPKEPAWVYHGEVVLPSGPFPTGDHPEKTSCGMPMTSTGLFEKGLMDNPELATAARIPIENFKGKVLLISGGDDGIWPSAYFADQIVKTIGERATHLHYPDAGHSISAPYIPGSTLFFHPKAKVWLSFGGNVEADSKASEESWEQVLNFLTYDFRVGSL